MACGACVLTTRRLALPEVGGDAVAYCGVGAGDIAAALAELLDDPALRAGLAAAAQRRAKEFSWLTSAEGHRAATSRRTGCTGAVADGQNRSLVSAEYGPELAVVIVTYSPGETLERCLDTLAKATTRPVRVVLADNGSTDGAPERAAAERENVTLLRTGGNLGYGTAANRGVAALGRRVRLDRGRQPDLEWGAGLAGHAAGGGRPVAARRRVRAVDQGAVRRGLPVGAAGALARARASGTRVVGRVWPANPWTRAYKQSDTSVAERDGGLAVRLLPADAPRGLRLGGRLRPAVLHVLRGRRPRRPAGPGRLAERLRAVGRGRAHPGPLDGPVVGRRCWPRTTRSAYRYIADRHRGWRWAPVRWAVRPAWRCA